MYDVIVIGGGPAGVTAALRARELGASVALVERGRMGGTCTNDGCVPTRVLAKAARLIRDAEQFDEYGLTGPQPLLEFDRLLARTQYTVYAIQEKKQLINHLQTSGAEVFAEAGSACFTDPHTIALPNGRVLQAEKFILCAGGRARRLDFPGAEYALTHSDVWSLKSLPRSIVVVGGAATGCQLASIFNAFGAQVTILEIGERLLRVEDAAVSEAIEKSFKEHGVEITSGIGGLDHIEKLENGCSSSIATRMNRAASRLKPLSYPPAGWATWTASILRQPGLKPCTIMCASMTICALLRLISLLQEISPVA
jgi:pyruvate/2-oxoglutarate dehydrogenase complex dihydrolipoamide dehydrogenase (E3) component